MKIIAIDHIQLAIPAGEEGKARKFYSEILGLTEIEKPASLAGRGGAWFQSDNISIHLGVEADFRPSRKAHPGFLVDDLNKYLEICQARGIEIDTTQPPLSGFKRAHIFDPFGNRIELIEKL